MEPGSVIMKQCCQMTFEVVVLSEVQYVLCFLPPTEAHAFCSSWTPNTSHSNWMSLCNFKNTSYQSRVTCTAERDLHTLAAPFNTRQASSCAYTTSSSCCTTKRLQPWVCTANSRFISCIVQLHNTIILKCDPTVVGVVVGVFFFLFLCVVHCKQYCNTSLYLVCVGYSLDGLLSGPSRHRLRGPIQLGGRWS